MHTLADKIAEIKSSIFSKTTIKIRIRSCHVNSMFLLLPVKKSNTMHLFLEIVLVFLLEIRNIFHIFGHISTNHFLAHKFK